MCRRTASLEDRIGALSFLLLGLGLNSVLGIGVGRGTCRYSPDRHRKTSIRRRLKLRCGPLHTSSSHALHLRQSITEQSIRVSFSTTATRNQVHRCRDGVRYVSIVPDWRQEHILPDPAHFRGPRTLNVPMHWLVGLFLRMIPFFLHIFPYA